jgi:DinB superfamily
MNAADREQILKLIAESDRALFAAVAGVSEEQARLRPAPDRWSILECLEHVILVDDSIVRRADTHSTPGAPPEDRSREELILRDTTDRTGKLSAPERLLPAGRHSSLPQAVEEYRKSRARTVAYIEQYQDDPHARTMMHPAFGPISCQEMFLVLALHPKRHALQIQEVRQTLGLE